MIDEVARKMIDAIKTVDEAKTDSYDTAATVKRIEGDTAWVHINGGVDETPVKLTIAASAGDNVQVRIAGGRAWIQGNATAPPTDDAEALSAKKIAHTAQNTATQAKDTAEVAHETATQAKDTADNAADNIVVLTFDLDTAVNGGYTVSAETTISDSGLDVSAQDFDEAVGGEFGTYNFLYDGSSWTLDGDPVNLEDYGITLADGVTLQSGDEINITLLEVEGFKEAIETRYDDLTEMIDNTADEAEENLISATEDLEDKISENALAIEATQSNIEELNTKTSRIGFSQEYGFVIFGQDATPSEKFKLQLTAQEINFVDGALGNDADINAQITNNMLNINIANITSQLLFGNYAFIKRSNNNMALKYLG